MGPTKGEALVRSFTIPALLVAKSLGEEPEVPPFPPGESSESDDPCGPKGARRLSCDPCGEPREQRKILEMLKSCGPGLEGGAGAGIVSESSLHLRPRKTW